MTTVEPQVYSGIAYWVLLSECVCSFNGNKWVSREASSLKTHELRREKCCLLCFICSCWSTINVENYTQLVSEVLLQRRCSSTAVENRRDGPGTNIKEEDVCFILPPGDTSWNSKFWPKTRNSSNEKEFVLQHDDAKKQKAMPRLKKVSVTTFWMVSSMDQPPFHGLVDFLMQLRLAMLCHFLSSSFL